MCSGKGRHQFALLSKAAPAAHVPSRRLESEPTITNLDHTNHTALSDWARAPLVVTTPNQGICDQYPDETADAQRHLVQELLPKLQAR